MPLGINSGNLVVTVFATVVSIGGSILSVNITGKLQEMYEEKCRKQIKSNKSDDENNIGGKTR